MDTELKEQEVTKVWADTQMNYNNFKPTIILKLDVKVMETITVTCLAEIHDD